MSKNISQYKKQIERLTMELNASETRFLRTVEENPDGIIIVNHEGILCYINGAAERLFNIKADEFIGEHFDLPVMAEKNAEITINQGDGNEAIAEMRVVETKWEGKSAYLASLRDITDSWQMRKKLEQTNETLNQTVEKLKTANKLIVEQQKSVIAEERLILLLQMAGAIAHDLNQPLMALLGNIELIKMVDDTNHKKKARYLRRIEEAGERISDSVKKIQNIRQDETIKHDSSSTIINLNQKINILLVENSKRSWDKIKTILSDQEQMELLSTTSIANAVSLLNQVQFDLIISDHLLSDGNSLNLIRKINDQKHLIPVIVITNPSDEIETSLLIQQGAVDCIPKLKVSHKSILKSISSTLDKANQKREIANTQNIIASISDNDSNALIYNRIHFMESLEREIAQAKRNDSEFAIYMMVVEELNKLNKSHNPPNGTEYGKILKNCLRKSDLICRCGNEEFGIILHDTIRKKATMASRRIHKAIENYNLELMDIHSPIKFGIGISCFHAAESVEPAEMIAQAQNAAVKSY